MVGYQLKKMVHYYNNQGQMVKNAWAGDYYLGSDGNGSKKLDI